MLRSRYFLSRFFAALYFGAVSGSDTGLGPDPEFWVGTGVTDEGLRGMGLSSQPPPPGSARILPISTPSGRYEAGI